MGTFSVRVTLSGPQGQLDCDALVDTGATYSVVPGQALRSIGVQPSGRRGFRLADESRIEYDVGPVTLRYEGEDVPVLVVFGDDSASPLLGATALESLSLAVDTPNERLTPVDALLKGAARAWECSP